MKYVVSLKTLRAPLHAANLTICFNLSVCPIILCVYYSCVLITFNCKEQIITFNGLTIKTKRILGLRTRSNASTNNYDACITDRY